MTLIETWIHTLGDEEYDHLITALRFLEAHGPVAQRPFVDTLKGSRHANMKELRPRTTRRGAHMRVLFAFDPQSRAVMLLAGDKAGNWQKWYAKNIPIADDLFDAHLGGLRRQSSTPTTQEMKR